MLGVEVFRDKQGLGQKRKDEGEAEVEKDTEEANAGENEEQMDSENGGESQSEPKVDQGTSSWGCGGNKSQWKDLTSRQLMLQEFPQMQYVRTFEFWSFFCN